MTSRTDKEQARKDGKAGAPELANMPKETTETTEEAPAEATKMPLSLEERISALEAGFEILKSRVGTTGPMTAQQAADAAERSAEEEELDKKINAERELRKYIKREGGFRKDLPKIQKVRARELLKALGRKELEYDLDLIA